MSYFWAFVQVTKYYCKNSLPKATCGSVSLVSMTNLFFFSTWFSFTDTDDSWDNTKREEPQTFRHLFETLHLKWLPRIFDHSKCNYKTLILIYPRLGISISLNVNCILSYWFNVRSCCCNYLQTKGGTSIDCHSSVISEPAKCASFPLVKIRQNGKTF